MKNNSLIYMNYLAQREAFKTFKDSIEEQEADKFVYELQTKFRKEIENNSQLLKLFTDLNNAHTEHLCRVEENAYREGFKTAVKLILEANSD